MKVLHVGKRYHYKAGVRYWHVNIVFQTEDNGEYEEDRLQKMTEEYLPVIGVVNVPDFLGNITDASKRKEQYRTVYVHSETGIKRANKSGVYYFCEYFIDCPTVSAILGELEYIKDGGELKHLRHTQSSHILCLLQALDHLWD